MAKLKVGEIRYIGSESKLTAISWKVSSDVAGDNVIDSNIKDRTMVKEWVTPLPKSDKPGDFYKDEIITYGWVKLHFAEQETNWVLLNDYNLNKFNLEYKLNTNGVISLVKVSEL